MKGCTHIVHLGALIAIPYSYKSAHEYLNTNVEGTLNVLEAAKELKVKKIIHTSTSEVYGTAQQIPILESHQINPQSLTQHLKQQQTTLLMHIINLSTYQL